MDIDVSPILKIASPWKRTCFLPFARLGFSYTANLTLKVPHFADGKLVLMKIGAMLL